jgi:predicted kinase
VLIVVSGLPGTGKSAVASGLASRFEGVHLSIDRIEDAMLGAGLPHGWTTGVAAYEATRAAAEQNLALGRTVVVDAVNDSEPARQTWRDAAQATAVALRFVVLVCSDEGEHRRRVENRPRTLRHVPQPTWLEVQARARDYEPWTDERIVVDTLPPLTDVIAEAAGRLTPP